VAQESLSVGIGALAGSTIMLLTVPWALSVYAGRVDIVSGKPQYLGKPKVVPNLSFSDTLNNTGVSLSSEIRHGGIVMALTTIPYFLIQIPALFIEGSKKDVALGEHWWSFAALVLCILGLIIYMRMQVKFSNEGQDKDKRIAIAKKTLRAGKMSLSGIIKSTIKSIESKNTDSRSDYGATDSSTLPDEVKSVLKGLLYDAFKAYDTDNNGSLERKEIRMFLKDFHENIDEDEVTAILNKVDTNNDDLVCLDEFVFLCYHLIVHEEDDIKKGVVNSQMRKSVNHKVFTKGSNEEEEEVEDIPEDFCDLSPEEQQAAIKLRAFKMLAMGTVLVIYFSDPMVEVMQEIAVKAGISPFYVSFVLAPLASNSSEVLASMFYAKKKTRKTMTVSLSALEGAACMNNTFCLSIFMGLVYFRGLAWQYTAETASIVIVQFIIAYLVQKEVMTTKVALYILGLFPLSLVFVAVLEFFGLD